MMAGYAPGAGLAGMLKDGAKHITAADSAVLRNIDACKQLGALVATSVGPAGRKKLVVNRLGRLLVTSDVATIVRELEVEHPAAKIVVMASHAQERDAGDGTGLVIGLAAQLLELAEDLLRMGLHTAEIADGYERAGMEAQRILHTLAVHKVADVKDAQQVTEVLAAPIASKQYGLEAVIAPLVTEACISVLPKNINMFSVENVRVAKILGGSVSDSSVLRGTVLNGDAQGTIKHLTAARIAVFTCDVDTAASETKGTVLLHSAKEFTNYTRSEEDALEARIQAIAEAGVNVLVSPKFGEMAMHFVEKYKIMAVKCTSKFDLRRVARTSGAIALAKLDPPTKDEIGVCDVVTVEEIGSTKCVVFRQETEGSRVSTIVLRASTDNLLEDLERAIDDAVNVYRGLTRDPRFVAGAGAAEMEISRQLQQFAEQSAGLDQYAIKKFAQAIEVIPRNIAENAGGNTTDIITNLLALHTSGKTAMGVNVEDGTPVDAVEAKVFDLLTTKNDAIRLATEAACTVLKVDQIIMAKTAGGPKPRDMLPGDANDEAP